MNNLPSFPQAARNGKRDGRGTVCALSPHFVRSERDTDAPGGTIRDTKRAARRRMARKAYLRSGILIPFSLAQVMASG